MDISIPSHLFAVLEVSIDAPLWSWQNGMRGVETFHELFKVKSDAGCSTSSRVRRDPKWSWRQVEADAAGLFEMDSSKTSHKNAAISRRYLWPCGSFWWHSSGNVVNCGEPHPKFCLLRAAIAMVGGIQCHTRENHTAGWWKRSEPKTRGASPKFLPRNSSRIRPLKKGDLFFHKKYIWTNQWFSPGHMCFFDLIFPGSSWVVFLFQEPA